MTYSNLLVFGNAPSSHVQKIKLAVPLVALKQGMKRRQQQILFGGIDAVIKRAP